MPLSRTELQPCPTPALLAALDRQCFAEAWSESDWRGLLAGPALHAWVLAAPGGEGLGLLAFQRAADEAELLRVGIVPARRGSGLGRRLLEHLLDHCRSVGVRRVWLEVRAGNAPARRLYAAAGFGPAGRRRGYYRDPPEDALVYAWPVP